MYDCMICFSITIHYAVGCCNCSLAAPRGGLVDQQQWLVVVLSDGRPGQLVSH